MTTRATNEYISGLHGRGKYSKLSLSEWQHYEVSSGRIPSSILACLIVSKVEFIRTRIWPDRALGIDAEREELRYDFRVHFMDGTYDCRSFGHDKGVAVGQFFERRPPPVGRLPVDTYMVWDEGYLEGGCAVIEPTIVVGGFVLPAIANPTKWKKPGKSEVERRQEANTARRFHIENSKPF